MLWRNCLIWIGIIKWLTIKVIFDISFQSRWSQLQSDSTNITHGCIALKSIFIGNRLNRDNQTEGKYRPIRQTALQADWQPSRFTEGPQNH